MLNNIIINKKNDDNKNKINNFDLICELNIKAFIRSK